MTSSNFDILSELSEHRLVHFLEDSTQSISNLLDSNLSLGLKERRTELKQQNY